MVLYTLPIGGANREILEFILACSTSCLVAAHRTDSDRGPLASVKYAVNLKINGGGDTEREEKRVVENFRSMSAKFNLNPKMSAIHW